MNGSVFAVLVLLLFFRERFLKNLFPTDTLSFYKNYIICIELSPMISSFSSVPVLPYPEVILESLVVNIDQNC